MLRKIIHLDLDAFFCAVEELHDPSLRGKPFAVGGRPDERGVVSSCSYPARLFGVRSAMPMSRALLLCPHLIVVPGRHGVYDEYSQQVMAHCYNRTNLVEQISIDEAFLDVSDLRPPAEAIARELQAAIWDELGLPCSLGVATNKLIAKIANNVGKAEKRSASPPMAIKVVPPGEEAAFLAPLPIGELWGIGPKTAASLEALGIHTIGDLARWPEADLIHRFGKSGADLAQRARGIDDRPVVTEYEAKSLSRETTFAHDITDGTTLRRTLLHLTESVGDRLRHAQLQGSTVKLKLRWADFTTITRQVTLPEPTDQDNVIYSAAQQLFEQAWPQGKPVRLIGVGVSSLGPPLQQLGLWETPSEKGQRLQDALDAVRDRFGRGAIKRASDLGK
ncbi:MAG TPA: DNA polymerase IV [Anaerolineae bacterium]|nr:DNA polymerase IV [Anaerolineae bacterium]HQI84842.1 DNA polymerase IV [Anaerolineae bacterium]